jgi:hypothetical protein
MTRTDLMYYQTNKKEVNLSHQCKTENGIEEDDRFTISDIIGDFEQVRVVNQYEQFYIINVNQIENHGI